MDTASRRIAAARCGTPMQVGVKNVYDKVVAFGWEPAPLLKKLAESNGKFADLAASQSPKGQGELTHA